MLLDSPDAGENHVWLPSPSPHLGFIFGPRQHLCFLPPPAHPASKTWLFPRLPRTLPAVGIELSHVQLRKSGPSRRKATTCCNTTGLGGPNPQISEAPSVPGPPQLAWFPEAVTDTRNHLGCPLLLSDHLGLSSQGEEPQVVTSIHMRLRLNPPKSNTLLPV